MTLRCPSGKHELLGTQSTWNTILTQQTNRIYSQFPCSQLQMYSQLTTAYPDTSHRHLKSSPRSTANLNDGPSSVNCQAEATPQRNAYQGRTLPAIYCDASFLSHPTCNEDNTAFCPLVTLRKAVYDIAIVQYTGWRLCWPILTVEISGGISVDNRNYIRGKLYSLTFLHVIYTTMFTL